VSTPYLRRSGVSDPGYSPTVRLRHPNVAGVADPGILPLRSFLILLIFLPATSYLLGGDPINPTAFGELGEHARPSDCAIRM